jgi:hypothetical protein
LFSEGQVLAERVLGFVTHVTRYIHGRIEIEFFDFEKEKIVTYNYLGQSGENDLPESLANALADSLGRNIWVKIEYEHGKLLSVSFEEYNFQKDVYKLKEKLEKAWPGYLERS